MQRGPTGTHHVTTVAGEAVRAFVPAPLPPQPPLDLSGARLRLLEQAQLACGRLDGVTALLPDPDLFLYAYVRREAVLSSQIEGTQSSLSDLLVYELDEAPGVPVNDVVEVSNYVAALEHGMQRMHDGFPLSNRLLREIHAILLASGRGAERLPGEFRRSQNWIGGTRPGNAHFVPAPPERLDECMAALERFIHAESDDLPALVRAAMAHVQFETIHPFLDGNGRVGRLLIALMLHVSRVLAEPLLYVSLYLKQHRQEYYRLLDAVRLDGDWEAWLDFYLEGVMQTAGGAVDAARRLLALFHVDEQRLIEHVRKAPSLPRAYAAVRARPVTTLRGVAQRSGVSYPTAAKCVELLERLGIIHELTGGRRNRIYAYRGYLDILSEGTEPL